jgi:SAM-dependent methyltransferase
MNESLDVFKDAYHEGFSFHDENIVMLSWYVRRVIGGIRKKNLKKALSLGIGHKVVSKGIISGLGQFLEKYVIVEGSREIIRELENELNIPSNISVVNALFEEFTSKEKYDAIEMGFVLEHVDDPSRIVRRYSDFLEHGGSIFIAVPNARSLHRLIGHEAGMLPDPFQLSPSDLKLGHRRYFDLESLVKLVTSSGLTVVNIEGIYLKPFSTGQLKSLRLSPDVVDALCVVGMKYPEISNALYIEATL